MKRGTTGTNPEIPQGRKEGLERRTEMEPKIGLEPMTC